MIQQPPSTFTGDRGAGSSGSDGAAGPPRQLPRAKLRLPRWRRRRWQVAALVVLLVVVISVVAAQRSAPPAAPAPQATAPVLVAHGKILPARQARVGTLGGGVVRQLLVTPGAQVVDHAEVARVDGGSAGAEIVTAPFAGVVTNVLVHEGDTVLPGATLLVVADPRTLQVETTDVDEFLVSYVHVGQPLQVTVDTLDNLALKGFVKSVAGLPQSDGNGGSSYPVVIGLDSVPSQVVAGMSIRVTFPAQ